MQGLRIDLTFSTFATISLLLFLQGRLGMAYGVYPSINVLLYGSGLTNQYILHT